ncbi:MAG: hypothetical protein JW951_06685 [Lentisphaerae bacterium]|nr:hypothetical protein [Lentisphaerota bacterium]
MKRPAVLAACLCGVLAAAAQDFETTVTFGDSLTANDILWRVYHNPKDLYGTDPFEAVFLKAAHRGDTVWNYAVPGTRSFGLLIETLLYARNREDGKQPPATVFSVQSGNNDLLQILDRLAAAPPGADPDTDALTDGVTDRLRLAVRGLARSHPAARVVAWTLADLTGTPSVQRRGYPPEALSTIRLHIERANAGIAALHDPPRVIVFDLLGWMDEIAADPPVIYGQTLRPAPATGGYDCLFADDLHPTAVANALVANALVRRLNDTWHTALPVYSEAELAALARFERPVHAERARSPAADARTAKAGRKTLRRIR